MTSYHVSFVSDYDRAALADILAGANDWFDAELFRLIAKADADNIERLRAGFPDHVKAFLDWRAGK